MADRIQKIFIDNHRLVGVPPHLRSYRYLRYIKDVGQNPKDVGQNPKDVGQNPKDVGQNPKDFLKTMFDRIQKIFIDNHRLVGVPPHLRSYRYLGYTKDIGENPKDFYRQPQVGGGTPTLTELSLPTIYKRYWTESKRFLYKRYWTESFRFYTKDIGQNPKDFYRQPQVGG